MFGFDDNDEHRHEAELFRLSQAPGGIDLAQDALRGRDVFSHLLDQKLGGGELFFLSDPFDKIETHCLSVEISLEIEDVTFDRQRAIAKGRIHPDTRDARPLTLADLQEGGIDPGWRYHLRPRQNIGRWKSERSEERRVGKECRSRW